MATIHYDLASYIKLEYEIEGNYPWWSTIKDVAKELEQEYFQNLNPEPGVHAYGDFGMANIKYANKKNTELFWRLGINELKKQGFKSLYGRISNPVSAKILFEHFGS